VNNIGKLLGGGIVAIVGLLGLSISAHTPDKAFGLFGMLLFLFSILIVFRFITLATAPAAGASKENA
jgi:phosphoglycerol transferase MdoB-like AlkP superfamily enzyme